MLGVNDHMLCLVEQLLYRSLLLTLVVLPKLLVFHLEVLFSVQALSFLVASVLRL